MATVPLHPALVHVPLALAVVVPLAAAVTWYLMERRCAGRAAWAAVVAAQLILVIGGVAALRSGGAEEERVEERVNEAALEHHEEAAQVFLFSAGTVLLLSVLGLKGPPAARRWTTLAATAGTFVVAGLAVRTGKAGGELVYLHGAAGSGQAIASAGERSEGGEMDRQKANDEDDDDAKAVPVAPSPARR